MTVDYKPEPIPTADVRLGEDLLALSETLAKNAHDRWAAQRLADGWRYGPTRNDERKEHPCLVPYESLPESEKTYDRTVALETLRVLVALGYVLQPPGGDRRAGAAGDDRPDSDAESSLRPAGLAALWGAGELAASGEDVYQQVGERALQLGKPLLACDVLEEAIKLRPGSPRLRQLQALALLRGGATERANRILGQLDREAVADEETLGLLARTHKDLGLRATDPAMRMAELSRAHEAYARAYRLTGGYWTGINAATLAVVTGHRETGSAIAREVRERCLDGLQQQAPRDDRYWILATLGEAALILGDWPEAEEWYTRAAEAGSDRLGDLSSTRRNARLLLDHLDGDRTRIEQCLRLPRVIVFTGHMIDAPGRRSARFPSALEDLVRRAIRKRVDELDGRLGFAAGACGGDILFLESILEVGGEANVVLPYGRDRFVADSVEIVPGWKPRFDRLLDRAVQVVVASPERLEGASASYDYASLLLLGLASIRAEQLETDLVALALWDGRTGSPGGTASVVEDWRRRGHEVQIIDVGELLRQSGGEIEARSDDLPSPPNRPDMPDAPRIMAILFADAVQFSKLTESQVPRFVEHFLGAIGKLADEAECPPVARNTWGDGLYLVFSGVREAGAFALRLSELVNRTDWAGKGLPPGLNLRVALHAGPVYSCRDPVTGQINYIGSHVSRGARIEPITPPGHVYASQAFAALAAAARVREFVCEYAGQTIWAKGYGTFPTYHVRRREPTGP